MIIFLTDGTLDSFYTAVFYAYTEKNCIVTSTRNIQLTIGAYIKNVVTEADKAERVKKKLKEYDPDCFYELNRILKSGDIKKENVALEYIRLIVKQKTAVRERLSDVAVINAMNVLQKVTYETHRMKGFLRFIECNNGVMYAPFSPDNDITEYLMPHFSERFKSISFIIHDIKRKKMGLYTNGKYILSDAPEKVDLYLSNDENAFQNLWKEYYNSVNIAERQHLKQMKGYMPVRYWSFLPEKQPK